MPRQLLGTAIASNTITTIQLQTTVVNQISAGGGPRVSSLIYPGDDTAANTVGGQTVYVVGSGFDANANVYINGNAVPSISFISASNLAITTPALSAATYPVYVINPETGATAIHIPGLRVSGDPSWVTAAGSLSGDQTADAAWSYTVSANSDSAVTYALAAGSSLPTGVSLAANGLISGTISSPPASATTYNFTVDATDAENQSASRAFSVTVTTGEGALFANNVLLIHADATNNKNNHTFIDSSSNNFTFIRNGNATQGTFSPFSQTGWSNSFDGTGDYLTLSSNTALSFSTGDFTLEFWVYFNSVSADSGFVGSTGTGGYDFLWRTSTGLNIGRINTAFDNTFAWSPTVGKWYHVAYCRSGTSLRAFIDGTQIGTTATNSTAYNSATAVVIGGSSTSDRLLNGYISNLRMLKGTASYTANFTPPTAALTAVSDTSLLTCQSNRFIDNSSNNFSITRNGDVSVQPFSPFAPTADYSTANVGGSGYFDGTGDYLEKTSGGPTIGTNPFTFETWAYFNTMDGDTYQNGAICLYDTDTGSYTNFKFTIRLTRLSGNYLVLLESYPTGSTGWTYPTPTAKQWYHFAIVRNSSNQGTLWVNGVRSSTGILTNAVLSANMAPTSGVIVGYNPLGGGSVNGYLSGTRLVIGSALYDVNSSTISVPTSPPTNVTNTALLLNYTNAGIFDQTAKNVIETVGDAKISTAQYKYGTGSMYFDGTGDYLKVTDNLNLRMESGSFTIEFWWYPVSIASYQTLFDKGYTGAGALLFQTGNGDGRTIIYAGGSSILTSNTAVSTNTWTHIALVRNGSTLTLYQNGNSVGSVSNSTNFSNTSIMGIGGNHSGSTFYGVNGYLDDLRITKGYARYTANFTPPTAAFKDK